MLPQCGYNIFEKNSGKIKTPETKSNEMKLHIKSKYLDRIQSSHFFPPDTINGFNSIFVIHCIPFKSEHAKNVEMFNLLAMHRICT